MNEKPIWKNVSETLTMPVNDMLHKIEVEGGYLYRSMIATAKGTTQTMCFVPTIKCPYHKEHMIQYCQSCELEEKNNG